MLCYIYVYIDVLRASYCAIIPTQAVGYIIVMSVCFRFWGTKIHKETKNASLFSNYILNGTFFLKIRLLVLAISVRKVTFVV